MNAYFVNSNTGHKYIYSEKKIASLDCALTFFHAPPSWIENEAELANHNLLLHRLPTFSNIRTNKQLEYELAIFIRWR